ncbi:phospholipase D-like domain-containing protein [Thermithiobacillus plumbiphilus]|uniref:Phospholipase D-like domain-containing protein n=1 Tax=Thermithiobacillus plumbiphilus TaxID=1729899 RepID=A0ABU9D989_9PROT
MSSRLLVLLLCGGLLALLQGCAHRLDGRVRLGAPLPHGLEQAAFQRAAAGIGHAPILSGNRVDILNNGQMIFPAMLDAIGQAKSSINLESYIFWSDGVGSLFAEALSERARAGVQVRVLLDAVGSRKLGADLQEKMRAAGCQVVWYRPAALRTLGHVNDRTHRRILVVDGRAGFTGSVGIADPWRGKAQSPDHWRDTQVRITGPLVAQMQAAFAEGWQEATGEALLGPAIYPELAATGSDRAQIVSTSPLGAATPRLRLLFELAIRSAQKRIYIANSYFVPDAALLDALGQAARRGVDVRILLPGAYIDVPFIQPISRARLGRLLRDGVKVYEYQPTMMHSKYMVVDGVWSSLGSSNLDNRSFASNNELNVQVYGQSFARGLEAVFLADLAKSRVYGLTDWQARSSWQRLQARLLSILEPAL